MKILCFPISILEFIIVFNTNNIFDDLFPSDAMW